MQTFSHNSQYISPEISMAVPFTIHVPQERLEMIRSKVANYDWDALADAGGWKSGVGLTDLKRLTSYWLERYDWRAQERRLSYPGLRTSFPKPSLASISTPLRSTTLV